MDAGEEADSELRESLMHVVFSLADEVDDYDGIEQLNDQIEESAEEPEYDRLKEFSGYNIHIPNIDDRISLADFYYYADEEDHQSNVDTFKVVDKEIHYLDTQFIEEDDEVVDDPDAPIVYTFIDIEPISTNNSKKVEGENK